MKKVIHIIKKNFRLIMKNRFSYIILFFLPLIVFMIMGTVYYNQNSYNLNVGFVEVQNNTLYNGFYNRILNSSLHISEYETKNNCMNDLKTGLMQVCVVFPENFDINNEQLNEVYLYFDNTKANIEDIVEHSLLLELKKETMEIEIENIRNLLLIIERTEVLINSQNQLTEEISFSLNELLDNNKELLKDISKLEEIVDSDDIGLDEVSKSIDDILTYKKELILDYDEINDDLNSEFNDLSDYLDDSNMSSTDKNNVDDGVDELKSLSDDVETKINSFNDRYVFTKVDKDISKVNENYKYIQSKLSLISDNLIVGIDESSEYGQKVLDRNTGLVSVSNYILKDINNLTISNSQVLSNPIDFVSKEIVSDKYSNINSHIPLIFTSLICVLSLFFGANLVFVDKSNKGNIRNILSKTSSINYVFGNLLTIFLIVFIQIGIILWIYSIIFIGNAMIYELPKFLFMGLFSILVFSSIGMFIGYISKTQNSYYLYLFIYILYLYIGAGKLIPIEIISSNLIRNFFILGNPFILVESLFRRILLFKDSFSMVYYELFSLILLLLIFVILNYICESYSKKRFVYYLFNKSKN